MRRVITTLAILFVVVVAGMTALVLLVNPNDFRTYMVQQVAQRSGYQLELHGDLRWHVWPKLSILAGRTSLTAPGATDPVVTAENMRLDVNLWPLLSHQLSVSKVMLKNAVVRVTPESEAVTAKNAPTGPRNSSPRTSTDNGWSFSIAQLQLSDSLLIWQPAGGEAINFRDFNLNLEQNSSRVASISLDTRVSRDQQNLNLDLQGKLDAAQYPRSLKGQISKLDYQLSGADLPAEGIKGNVSLQGSWDGQTQRFDLTQLQVSANDSTFSGNASGDLLVPQQLALNLHATNLNFDRLLTTSVASDTQANAERASRRGPVIAEPRERPNADSPLNAMNLDLHLQADNVLWRGLALTDFRVKANDRLGLMTLETLEGHVGTGHFSVPGSVDIRQPVTQVALQPELHGIPLQPLLKALALPDALRGDLDFKGMLQGETLDLQQAKNSWQGTADVQVNKLEMGQIDPQQMLQRAVARISNRVSNDDNVSHPIDQLNASVTLNDGVMTLQNVQGGSDRLALKGAGAIDLARQSLDVTLGIQVSGWKGDDSLVNALSQQSVPLRMYGSWQNVQYSLPVDQVMRQQLQNEAKSRLNQWLDSQSPPQGQRGKPHP